MMDLQANIPEIISIIAAGIALFVAVYSWSRRGTPGGFYFALLMLAISIWSIANLGEFLTIEAETKIIWSKASYLGIVCVSPLWLLFAAGYTERLKWLKRWKTALLWVIPLAIVGLTSSRARRGR